MPQLDVSTYTSQLFWLIICFTVLYFTLKNSIIPRLDQIIKNRWNHIEGAQNKAKEFKKETELFNSQGIIYINKARKLSHEVIDNANKESRIHIAQKRLELSEQFQKRLINFKSKIKEEEKIAESIILKELPQLTIESVIKASQETIAKKHIEKILNQKFSFNNSFKFNAPILSPLTKEDRD